jgi:hypothetical protein
MPLNVNCIRIEERVCDDYYSALVIASLFPDYYGPEIHGLDTLNFYLHYHPWETKKRWQNHPHIWCE